MQPCRWTGPHRVLVKHNAALYTIDKYNEPRVVHVRHTKSSSLMSESRRIAEVERHRAEQLPHELLQSHALAAPEEFHD